MLFLIIITIVAAVIALGGLFVLTFIHVVFIENRSTIPSTVRTHQTSLDRTSEIVPEPPPAGCLAS